MIKSKILELLRAARAHADDVLDRVAFTPVQRAWDKEVTGFQNLLTRFFRGSNRNIIQPFEANQLLQVSTRFLLDSIRRLSGAAMSTTHGTLTGSAQGLAKFLAKAGRADHGLSSDVIRQIVLSREAEVSRLRAQVLGDLGVSMREDIRRQLLNTAVDPIAVGDMISALGESYTGNWWQLERIIRTETAFAYNTAISDSLQVMQHAIPGLRQRWSELVDDATWQPLDNRVAADSMVMHGQLASDQGLFKQPDGPGVPAGLVGQSWAHPPNRPNDRSIITPWLPDWNIPAWIWDDDDIIWLRRPQHGN